MKKETKKKLIIGFVVLAVIGMFLPNPPQEEVSKKEDKKEEVKIVEKKDLSNEAYTFCKILVEKELAPYTVEFPWGERTINETGVNEYVVKSTVTTQNKYGAKLKKNYKCNIAYKGSGEVTDGVNWSYSISFN